MKKFIFTGVFILISTVTHAILAAEPINMNINLKDEKGEILKDPFIVAKEDPTCLKCVDLTIGAAIAHALNASLDDDRNLSWEQKWAMSVLADRIKKNSAAILVASEIVKIEERIGKMYSGIIIGQIIPILEPGREPPKVQ